MIAELNTRQFEVLLSDGASAPEKTKPGSHIPEKRGWAYFERAWMKIHACFF